METSKIYERINWYKKEYVYDQYSRIVEHIKDYDKITKKKMLESVYKVYNDFDINNKKIKKFLEEIKKLPFFWFKALDIIREFAVLI